MRSAWLFGWTLRTQSLHKLDSRLEQNRRVVRLSHFPDRSLILARQPFLVGACDICRKSAHFHNNLLRTYLIVNVSKVSQPPVAKLGESNRRLILVDRIRREDPGLDCGLWRRRV
jgi:hypothetical protein